MHFSSIKERNRLISKGMSNIYLKVIIEKKWCILQFSKFKKFVFWSLFGELQLMQILLNFQTFCSNLKISVLEQNCVWLFSCFDFERNYDVLKSKCQCFLLNKNINFNKIDTGSKIENLGENFREMNLVLQLV